MRLFTATLALVLTATSVRAQANKAAPKPDSSKAAPTSAAKAPPKPDSSKAAPASAAKAPNSVPNTASKTAAPDTKTQTKQATPPATQQAGKAPATTPAPAGTKAPVVAVTPPPQAEQRVPTILREVFDYSPEGRRDPFVTLLSSNDLRPTVNDLRVTGILYDENGPNSIAVMRDITTDEQYRVVTGQTLGRMKVVLIKRKTVIFSIEAFGLNRQDSLVLGDSTRARAK